MTSLQALTTIDVRFLAHTVHFSCLVDLPPPPRFVLDGSSGFFVGPQCERISEGGVLPERDQVNTRFQDTRIERLSRSILPFAYGARLRGNVPGCIARSRDRLASCTEYLEISNYRLTMKRA